MLFNIGIIISLRSKWRLTVSLRRFAPSDTVRLHTYPVPVGTTFPRGEGITLLTPNPKTNSLFFLVGLPQKYLAHKPTTNNHQPITKSPTTKRHSICRF